MADEEQPQYTVEYLERNEGEEETLNWIKKEGKVKITYPNGDIFEGYVDSNKQKQGTGVYTWLGPGSEDEEKIEISKYEGNFSNGQKDGIGKMKFHNGDVYEGQWKEDLMDGEGSYTYFKSKDIYSGAWLKGKKHGFGQYEFFKDQSILEGTWVDGQITTGKWIMKNYAVYEGKFQNGKPVDAGAYKFDAGLIQSGEYIIESSADVITPTENDGGEDPADSVPSAVPRDITTHWNSHALIRM